MPKQKKASRKPARRPQGDPRTRSVRKDEVFPLPLGPARTLLQAQSHPNMPDDLVDFMGVWPFNVGAKGEGASATSLKTLADGEGKTVIEVADAFVALEDMGLLAWDERSNTYWRVIPATGATMAEMVAALPPEETMSLLRQALPPAPGV